MNLSLGILIPTYDRWPLLTQVVSEIFSSLTPYGQQSSPGELGNLDSLTLVIINDGGPEPPVDVTKKLEELKNRFTQDLGVGSGIHILCLNKNQGQQVAILSGLSYILALPYAPEHIITMDDDGGHPPQMLPFMVTSLLNLGPRGLVYGNPSKASCRSSILRTLGTKLNTWLFQTYLNLPKTIQIGSFRGFTKELGSFAMEVPVTYGYLSAMLLTAGAQVRSVNWSPEDGSKHLTQAKPIASSYSLRKLIQTYGKLLLHWGPLTFLLRWSKSSIKKPWYWDPHSSRVDQL